MNLGRFLVTFIVVVPLKGGGRDISVGTATGYGLDGPGLDSRVGREFSNTSGRPWGPPNILYSGYRLFPGSNAAGA
jgi:hypothetical protein